MYEHAERWKYRGVAEKCLTGRQRMLYAVEED